MNAPIFRVSEAEAFRQWRDDPEAELGQILARLRGQIPPTEAMLAGTAFHAALELAQEDDQCEDVFIDGHWFHFPDRTDIALPVVREIRADKTYLTAAGPITISGQLDAIDSRIVVDHKTTARFDPERYLSGYQWRLYLDIFGADVFRWNVFVLAAMSEPDTWIVKEMHRLEQHRYPGLTDDCGWLAQDLAEFASIHLPERTTLKQTQRLVVS